MNCAGRASRLGWLRRSAVGLALAVAAWASGCATVPRPMVDPGYAARAYTPARVALMPPDVFVVLDQAGENDPAQSAALGQQVTATTVRAIEQTLRSRGYAVDLSARWDGIVAPDGSPLVSRDELGALANGIVSFANSPDGGGVGVMATPRLVAPELAAHVGWATQSDALLYVNIKGAVTTNGKRAASIVAGVFFLLIVVAVVVAVVASQKNGGGGGPGIPTGGSHGAPVTRAAPGGGAWRGSPAAGGGSAWHGSPPVGGGSAWHGSPPVGAGGSAWRGSPPSGTGGGSLMGPARSGAPAAAPGGGWRGSGTPGAIPRGAPVYRGGGSGVGIGIGVVIPIDGPVYTHEGAVAYEDPLFAGDELYVSMTLVSTYDGRVLWHARDHLDLDADEAPDIERMVHAFLDTLPPAGPAVPAAAIVR